jgi:hypothetical protein
LKNYEKLSALLLVLKNRLKTLFIRHKLRFLPVSAWNAVVITPACGETFIYEPVASTIL